ncbi:MAG: hypothetical protein V3V30_06880 [Parvularculaceae bacterium]
MSLIVAIASSMLLQAATDTIDASRMEAEVKIDNGEINLDQPVTAPPPLPVVDGEIVLDQSASAKDSQIKYSETVVCVKNETGQDNVYLVMYEMFRNSQPKNRILMLEKNKTNCTRYDDARKIVVDFKTQSQIDSGDKSGMSSAACKRVKGGFAKFYVISQSDKGRNRCAENKAKTENTIRDYVKAARPIR